MASTVSPPGRPRVFAAVISEAVESAYLNFRADTALPDLIIKRRSDGQLFYDNEYTPPVPLHLWYHSIMPGGDWIYAILIQNDGDVAGDVTLTAPQANAPFNVKYTYGYFDITASVTGPGFTYPNVPPGGSVLLGVRFRADATTPTDAISDITLTATSVAAPALHDAVTLRVIAGS